MSLKSPLSARSKKRFHTSLCTLEALKELVSGADFDAVLLSDGLEVLAMSASAKKTVVTRTHDHQKHLLVSANELLNISVPHSGYPEELNIYTSFGISPALIMRLSGSRLYLVALLPELSLLSDSEDYPSVVQRIRKNCRGYAAAMERFTVDSNTAIPQKCLRRRFYKNLANELINAPSAAETEIAPSSRNGSASNGVRSSEKKYYLPSEEFARIMRAADLFEESCADLPESCKPLNASRFLLIAAEAMLLTARCRPVGKIKLSFKQYEEGVELCINGRLAVQPHEIAAPLSMLLLQAFGASVSTEGISGDTCYKILIPYSGNDLFEIHAPSDAEMGQDSGRIMEKKESEAEAFDTKLLEEYLAYLSRAAESNKEIESSVSDK